MSQNSPSCPGVPVSELQQLLRLLPYYSVITLKKKPGENFELTVKRGRSADSYKVNLPKLSALSLELRNMSNALRSNGYRPTDEEPISLSTLFSRTLDVTQN